MFARRTWYVTYLVETVLTTITDVNDLDDLCSQTRVEHVTLAELGLEVRATREDKTSHVDFIVGNEVLYGQFGNLPHVVVALLVTKTRETQCGLTTTAVLLGEIDGEFVDDFAGVTSNRAEQSAVTVHNDEAELRVRLEKFLKRLSMELVVAEV